MTDSETPAEGSPKPSPAEFDLMDDWEPTTDTLGAAYIAAASVLDDGQWHAWFEIHDHMAAACPDATESELRTFFRKAVRQGWFTKSFRAGAVDQYRVTKCGLISRPELRGREGQSSIPPLWRELREQVDWLDAPHSPRPDPVPEQPRPVRDEKPKGKREQPPVPTVAQIIATEGQLHPTENCRCGQRLVFRQGKRPPKGDRWQCPLNRSNPGWDDPNHDRKWANP